MPSGLAVAPGFIDIHSHSDYTLLIDPRAMSAVAQGVTLEVIGNCGFGCAPIADTRLAAQRDLRLRQFDPADLAGHRRLSRKAGSRAACDQCDDADAERAASARDARPDGARRKPERNRRACAIFCARGCPKAPPATRSVSNIRAKPGRPRKNSPRLRARPGGPANSSRRIRATAQDRAAEAVEEVIRIARNAEVQLQVSHLIPRCDHKGSLRCVEVVDEARARGQDIAFDMHTRLYGTTMLSTLLPPWALTEGSDGVRRASRRARTAAPASRPIRA